MSIDSDFLTNLGGLTANSLKCIIEQNDIDVDDEPNLISHSPYFNNEMFIDTLKRKPNVFKSLCLNIQSLNAKIDQLRIYVNSLHESNVRLDAIILQETWINSNMNTSHLNIDGYNLISQPCEISKHGGLAIYILDHIEYERLDIVKSQSGTWEGMFVKIKVHGNTNLTVGNIYRPPRDLIENYTSFTKELEQQLLAFNGNVLIGGDFNLDLLKIHERQIFNDYFDTVLSCGYIPKITLPTRITNNSGTLIDNFFCKISNEFANTTAGILTYKLSDHQPIFICLDYLETSKKYPKYVKVNNRSVLAVQNFKIFLQRQIFISDFSHDLSIDPNLNYDKLNNIIKHGLDTCMPSKLVRYKKHKHKNNKWITIGLIKSISFRDKLYAKLKSTPLTCPLYAQLKINLNTYNRILKKAIKEVKKNYYHNCFERFKNDLQKTWKTIKDILSSSKCKSKFPEYFIINNSKVHEKETIAEEFNNFFVNTGPTLASNIRTPAHKSYKDYISNTYTQSFCFKTITSNTLSNIINKLHSKSSTGFDKISTILLKKIAPELIEILTIIINQTLTSGIFPSKLKIAKVVPLFKKDDPCILNNYRPISILSAISKTFEKVMFNQIHEFFNEHNLYFSNQYGFRQLHSTELALIELTDKIIFDMDKGKIPINIYMDLSKAFDTIDHRILVDKFKYYGFANESLALIDSYLSNRQQYTDIDGVTSSFMNLSTGVPQGSILGPLLFIIYINDLHESSNSFSFLCYADDTTLSVSLSNDTSNTVAGLLNEELNKVNDWLQLNKLSLNIDKTKCMMFHTKQKVFEKPILQIDNCVIEYVDNFNFLGVIINKNLSWNTHLDVIAKKISKTIGILSRLKHCLPLQTLKTMYTSLIASHLNYGIMCWGFRCNRLLKLQKKAIRTITNSKYNSHTEPLFKRMNLLTINDMLSKKMYKFYFRMKHSRLPFYFPLRSWLIEQSETHAYNTRNSLYLLPRINHSFAEFCVRYQLPYLLNKNVKDIIEKVHTHSELGFTNYVKVHLVSKYKVNCEIVNCYICGRISANHL